MVKDVFAVGTDLSHILSHPLCLDLPPTLVHAPKKPTASRRVIGGALEVGVVSQLVREEAVKAGLVPTDSWIRKAEQFLLMSQQKHGKQFRLCTDLAELQPFCSAKTALSQLHTCSGTPLNGHRRERTTVI